MGTGTPTSQSNSRETRPRIVRADLIFSKRDSVIFIASFNRGLFRFLTFCTAHAKPHFLA
jgi:hypothetical protein